MLATPSGMSRKTVQGLALLAAICAPSALFAQGCAFCYQTAAAGSVRFIQALKGGIFALLIPSVLIGAGVCFVSYRRRNPADEDEVSAGE